MGGIKRIDGIYQNPEVFALDRLTVGEILSKTAFSYWIIDGDRRLLRWYRPKKELFHPNCISSLPPLSDILDHKVLDK